MKRNNKKLLSFLLAISMVLAYIVPFSTVAMADGEIVWSFASAPAGTKLVNVDNKEKEWYKANTDLGNGLTAHATDSLDTVKNEYSNGFEIDRKSSNTFTVGDKTEQVTGALKFGGKSKSDGRFLTFTPTLAGTLTAYVKHGSPNGSDTRTLTITQGSTKKDISVTAKEAVSAVGSLEIVAGTVVNLSVGGNVALAKLVFTPASNPSGTTAPTGTPNTTTEPTTAPTGTPNATTKPTTVPTATPNVTTEPTATPNVTTAPTTAPTATPNVTTAPTTAPTATPNVTTAPTTAPTATPKAEDLSPDEIAVRKDADSLKLKSVSQTAVYFDLDLDKTGENGSTITWESSNSKYLDIQTISSISRNYTGVVTRPGEEECDENGGVPVTLTATLKKGDAEIKKKFEVSVRMWNPNVYYNDFEADVGEEAQGTYAAISDNVAAANGKDTFRGIRIDTLKESRCFDEFEHGDPDRPAYFDKRVMSLAGTPYDRPSQSGTGENFAFYYSEYNQYGGSSTIPMWIRLTDKETGKAPEGIVIMTMDICVIDGTNKFNLGFGNAKPSQMCRFLLANGETKSDMGYPGAGYLRSFSNESSIDFMGGKNGYKHPVGKWVKAVIVANADSHKWDFYYDGMQIGTSFDFRNAQDMVSTIEFTMDRNTSGGAYLIDNIYVENITEDYRNTYWDALEINTIPYSESSEAYTANKPFLLQYQGTDGLSGNYFTWQSSDPKALSIETKRIPVEDLSAYGYTDEQIQAYKNAGVSDASVVIATPHNITSDKYVTLTAKLEIGSTINKKEFKVLLQSGNGTQSGDSAKAKADAVKISCVKDGATVTDDIALDMVGDVNGSQISWKSSNEKVISSTGRVNRPKSGSAVTVSLTATVKYGDAVEYRTFNVKVTPMSQSSGGSGGGGGGGGSSVTGNGKGQMASTQTNIEPSADTESAPKPEETARPEGTPAFSDLVQTEWAREAVEYLYGRDVVDGYGNGIYGVNDDVTREQFVKMLLSAFGFDYNIGKESKFTDVDEKAWYANYVRAAYEAGIVSGISDTEFGVGQPISRQDMAVMCMRALRIMGKYTDNQEEEKTENTVAATAEEPTATEEPATAEEPTATEEPATAEEPTATEEPATAEPTFIDKDDISDYAYEAIAKLFGLGYISGDDTGKFVPKKSSTRAETATVLYRIMIQEGM